MKYSNNNNSYALYGTVLMVLVLLMGSKRVCSLIITQRSSCHNLSQRYCVIKDLYLCAFALYTAAAEKRFHEMLDESELMRENVNTITQHAINITLPI